MTKIPQRRIVCSKCGRKVSWHLVQEVVDWKGVHLEVFKIPNCKKCNLLDVPVKIKIV